MSGLEQQFRSYDCVDIVGVREQVGALHAFLYPDHGMALEGTHQSGTTR